MHQEAKAYTFFIYFLTSFIACCCIVGGIVFYANPNGNYGKVGFHGTYNSHLAKLEFLLSLPFEELPEAYVVGSSNTMRYRPALITELTGLRAFNYGVYWGRADDFLCIVKFLVHDLPRSPKLIIIGLDPWTLRVENEDSPQKLRLRYPRNNTPQLLKYHPDVSMLALSWGKFTDLLSEQHLRLSLNLLRFNSVPYGQMPDLAHSDRFAIDGTRTYYGDTFGDRGNILEDVDAGRYPISEHLEKVYSSGNLRGFRHFDSYNIDSFDPRYINYIREILDFTEQEKIEIIFSVNPVHPVFARALSESTSHKSNLETLRKTIAEWQTDHPNLLGYVDASSVELFGLDPNGFYDDIHPSTSNSDRIVQQIAKLYRDKTGQFPPTGSDLE